MALHAILVMEFLKTSFIFPYKTLIPFCVPTLPPSAMIWTNLNLDYIRKLSHKFHHFWHVDLQKMI